MDKIKLSIIVPIYMVEPYIRNCVDILLDQPFKNCEIILVDDGSPDNSGKICDEYAQKDTRVVVIHKLNGGLSSARNAGLDIARGAYITFVDSDDKIEKDSYFDNMNLLEQHEDIDILEYPTYWNYGSDSSYMHVYGPVNFYGSEEIFSNWWEGKPITPAVWNKIFRREIFENIRFPEGQVFEDLFLIVNFSEIAKRVFLSNKGLYYYYIRENSISHCTYSVEKHMDHFTAQFKNYKKLYEYSSLSKFRLIAFMRVLYRLIIAKEEYRNIDIRPRIQELSEYLPTWCNIWKSTYNLKEKVRASFFKLIGLNNYLKLFFLYKK